MFNSQINGKNGSYWFIGQIVDQVNWEGNTNTKIHFRDDVPGWGYRYKLSIFGRHPETKDVPDDQLAMSEVVFPITAGSGHGGSVQTPNIKQGSYVVGFYKDGIDATEPIITGMFMNNSQTRLFGGDPELNFVPRSGYFGKSGSEPLATKNIGFTTDIKFPARGSLTVETPQQVVAIYHYDQIKDGARCKYIPKTRACDGKNGELKGIQREIKNVINFVNDIKNISGTLLGQATDLTNQIRSLVDDASTFISNLIKTLLDKVRGFVVNKFNNGLKDLINLVPPNLIPKTNLAAEKGTDAIQCGFNKIISKLFDLVKGLLEDIIEKYVNAPMCAVEQFVIDVLDNVLGDITDTVKSALDAVTGIIGKVTSFLDQGFGILEGILSFLSCEEKPDCSMVEQWSFWYGAKCFGDEITDNFDNMLKNLGKNTGSDQENSGCNTDQLPCGPPSLVVDGFGVGSGALGNPIISQSGSVLGVDLLSGGQGYFNPNVQIVDTCGNGNGVVAVAKVKNPKKKNKPEDEPIDENEEGILEDVIIIEPGVGFLPSPNNSTGANQDVYSNPTDTIYEDSNGNKTVFKCGDLISTLAGDTIYLPPGTTTEVYDENGNALQSLNGLGQLTPIIITASGNLTAPCNAVVVNDSQTNVVSPITFPNSSNGSYPVALGIGTIFVTNPGVGYTTGDTIILSPDNGAIVSPIITDGQLVGSNVIQSGIGFTEIPKIIINSTTGVNATAVPVFKIIRADETPEEIPLGTPLIEVIDCVGRTVNRVAHTTV